MVHLEGCIPRPICYPYSVPQAVPTARLIGLGSLCESKAKEYGSQRLRANPDFDLQERYGNQELYRSHV